MEHYTVEQVFNGKNFALCDIWVDAAGIPFNAVDVCVCCGDLVGKGQLAFGNCVKYKQSGHDLCGAGGIYCRVGIFFIKHKA